MSVGGALQPVDRRRRRSTSTRRTSSSATPPAGLDADRFAAARSQQTELNWLNIFYAAEWIIFAGFAVFLWYRLVKDAKEREDEELRELEARATRRDRRRRNVE